MDHVPSNSGTGVEQAEASAISSANLSMNTILGGGPSSTVPAPATTSPVEVAEASPSVTATPALSLAALTPTSSNGGTLSFQQPFLFNLPPIPPIDQQPASQAPRKVASGKSKLESSQATATTAPAPMMSATAAPAPMMSASASGIGSSLASGSSQAPAALSRHGRKQVKSSISHRDPAPIAPAPSLGAAGLNVMAQTQLLNTLSLLQMGAINPFLPPKVETSTAQQAPPPLRGNTETGAVTGRQRKPCNCSKSMCLKLYCECFANGEFCSNCKCNNCHNNIEHEADRSTAIKACLERNPHAFHPKIQTKRQGEKERRHTKGCHCRRSGCLKNYCECYEARIPCTVLCKCIKCKNYEESPDRQTLLQLATAAEVRTQQQNAAVRKHLATPKAENATPLTSMSATGERLPYTMLQEEVTTAMCECWMQRAEQASEQETMTDAALERAILEEVDMCLRSVILKASQPAGRLRS